MSTDWARGLGTAKFYYNMGKEYGDLVRGGLTGSAVVTWVGHQLGLSPLVAVAAGVTVVLPVTLLLAVLAGWAVVRWRVIHRTLEHEWQNSPYQVAQLEALHNIRAELIALRAARSGAVPEALVRLDSHWQEIA